MNNDSSPRSGRRSSTLGRFAAPGSLVRALTVAGLAVTLTSAYGVPAARAGSTGSAVPSVVARQCNHDPGYDPSNDPIVCAFDQPPHGHDHP
jgi:hypothetical protein